MTHHAYGICCRTHELLSAFRHLVPKAQPEGDDFRGIMLTGMSKYISVKLGSMAVGYATQLLLARWMGTSDYGFYTLAVTTAAVLAHIATLGFPTAVDRFLPQYAEDNEWPLYRGLVRRSTRLTVQTGSVIFLLALPIIYFSGLPQVEKICLVIGMLLVPVMGCQDLFSGALQSLKRIAASVIPDELVSPLGFLAAITAMYYVFDDLDAIHMLAALFGVQLVVLILQAGWLRAVLPAQYFSAEPQDKVRKWLKTAVPVLLMTMFGIVVYRADLLLVGMLLGRTQAGVYAAVLTTSELIAVFMKSARTVASPHIAPLEKHGNIPGLQRLMSTVSGFSFVPAVLSMIVCIAFGRQILGLFGSGFDVGYPALVVLAISQTAKTVFGAPGLLLLLTGRQRTVAKVYMVAMIVDLAAQFVLISYVGLMGAAIASLITVVIAQFVMMVTSERELGVFTSVVATIFKRA